MKSVQIVIKKLSFINLLFVITFVLIFSSCKNNNYSTNPTPTSGSPVQNEVWMQNSKFNPASLTIAKGTKITWTNKDSYDHTVTSGTPGHPTGLFDSGNVASGGTFNYTFDSTGTFQYYCRIHADIMQGTIVVN
ncbi:MAG: cupredoxin domain-containing protein [Bacteroidetes bacterium]|nr:cupredoxin domain-containing protein [Bacteroidota bacterium]